MEQSCYGRWLQWIYKKEVLSDPKDDNEEHASTAPEYTNISKDYKINLAFHQVTSMDGNATLAQMVADAQE